MKSNLAVLGLVVIASFASVYIALSGSRDALHNARTALTEGRDQRKAVDYRLCGAVKTLRTINNHDRATILRSQRSLVRARKDSTGFLRRLIDTSIQANRLNLRDRPYLKPLVCRRLIESPPRK